MSAELKLVVSDYQGPDHWNWTLYDARGNYIQDQEVRLDHDKKEELSYRGYRDLRGFLRSYVLPNEEHDRRAGDQRLLADLGAWMGEHLLGNLRPAILNHLRQPATIIRLVVPTVPAEAQDLLFVPLELAHLEARKTLVDRGVRFVYQREDVPGDHAPKDTGEVLRVLLVFSLPTDASPLNLRRERVELKGFLETLASTRSLAVETRVLQYGATRATLEQALREAPGWDVVHFSCHGMKGSILLEDEQGKADPIDAGELRDLLLPSKDRLKLVILSACWSAAGLSLQEARRMLGLPARPAKKPPDDSAQPQAQAPVPGEPQDDDRVLLPSLAQDLCGELDCAALAMRYPVGDRFATDLVRGFLKLMLENNQAAPAALQLALGDALRGDRGADAPAISSITPVLFGPRAAALRLTAPARPPDFQPAAAGLIEFPPEPPRFVGRLRPMLRASAALAPQSPLRGVLFYGMAGAGKTACALELAWRHEEDRFPGAVFFKCPNQGEEIATALVNCLSAAENQLGLDPGTLIANVDQPELFRSRTVPMLKRLLKQKSILWLIDNMESLLSDAGAWRDPKWADLLEALTGHDGPSRVVLTSRRRPAGLEGHAALLCESIHALSLPESVILAKELPNLGRFFDSAAGRELIARALEVIQGHPKLLELADALAADRGRFAAQVERAREAAEQGGAPLRAFFDRGESDQTEESFTDVLGSWTAALSAELPPTARLLFHFLCRIEDVDRDSLVIQAKWKHFLTRLKDSHPDAAAALEEPHEGLPASLDRLAASGLVSRETIKTRRLELDEKTKEPKVVEVERTRYGLHPGVAEAGRKEADQQVLGAADTELGDFYLAVFQQGLETETVGGGPLVVEGARRAVPYLVRARRWKEAATLLEQMINRDQSPATLNWAIPLLRRIAEEARETKLAPQAAGLLAKALLIAGRAQEAEQTLREVIARCEAQGEYRTASVAAGKLVDLLRRAGQLDEALKWVEKRIELTGQGGLGPWTQLADEGQRLQVLEAMGRWPEVLDAVHGHRERLNELPEKSDTDEAAVPWNVRETLLNTGWSAAVDLEEWQTALELNAEVAQSEGRRGAGELEIAATRFNDYGPLLRLGRFDDARRLLEACRTLYEEHRDLARLGKVYGALADLEDKQGHRDAAIRFQKSGLKYAYRAGGPEDCAGRHNNLANYLERAGQPADVWLLHLLAAGLMRIQTGSGTLQTSLRNLALSDLPAAPPSFDEVADAVEQIEGVRFRALFDRLPKRYPDGDAALAALWEMAKQEQAKLKQRGAQREALLASLPPRVRAAFDLEGEAAEQALKGALDSLPGPERENVLHQLREAGLIGVRGPDMEQVLREWAPLLEGIAAVARGEGGPELRQKIQVVLPKLEEHGWRIALAVHRIWDGQRDPDALTAGLDEQDRELVRQVLKLIESPG